MTNERKLVPGRFFRTETGREPVRDWLKSLDPEDRRLIGADIKMVEYGWPVGMPVCKPLGRHLWEIRTALPHGRVARMLFCIYENKMVLLHGFIKKSQKTPKIDLALALQRKAKLEGE